MISEDVSMNLFASAIILPPILCRQVGSAIRAGADAHTPFGISYFGCTIIGHRSQTKFSSEPCTAASASATELESFMELETGLLIVSSFAESSACFKLICFWR